MPRLSWDCYFMEVAKVVSSRSTCSRLSVGAVLVKNKTILSTGYNGSVRGLPHCNDVGCMVQDSHCIATVHAEVNAIGQAARNGVCVENAICYVTHSPCWNCFKVLVNSGVKRIVYNEMYRADTNVIDTAKKLGIYLEKLTGTDTDDHE